MKATVIGGGVGGLSAAIGLHRAGVEVEVLERRSGPSAEGSGLSLFANGFTALDAIGAGDAVRGICAPHPPQGRAGIRRPDGSWLSHTDPVACEGLRIVHRAELLTALRSCLPEGATRWACEVTELSEDADLVVAADGIDSHVRRSWPGDPGTECVGYGAWRGITGAPVDLGDSGGGGETWGRGLRFGHVPLRDGRVYWFAVSTSPPGAFEEPPSLDALSVFERWHDPIGPIVRATAPEAVFWLPIRELRHVAPSFVRGRVVLLGDAAHAMTPNLGQGANQALEDAATLATVVAQVRGGETELIDALAQYDSLRRPRTAMVASRAHRIGALAHPRLPWPTPLRDLLLRAVPDAWVTRQAVALQTWSPPT